MRDTGQTDNPPAKDSGVPIPTLLEKLSTSRDGLSSSEAARRLQQYGRNEIEEKKQSRLVAFLRYFWGPIPWMIEAAAVISAVIQHWDDLSIILILLGANAVVGFWQENKASNAIELLKKRLALRATVLRDRKWVDVPAAELVPGDIARLRLGNIVPADARLIDGDYLLVDQSALTGESLPVEKHQDDLAYASSIVRQGEMDGVVTATGMGTYFGKTTKLVEEAETKSHFQKAILKIGDYLIAMAAALVTVTTLVGLYRQLPPFDLLQFGLVLVVAAIPAAMPAVLSVSMAVGAEALARKEAIVSKLVAIEEMAGVDVLCADKTGTLTENRLNVEEVRPFDGIDRGRVLALAALASAEGGKDPVGEAVRAAAGRGADFARLIRFVPYDPAVKMSEALAEIDGVEWRVIKGACATVAEACGGGVGEAGEAEALSAAGRRVLAVAAGPVGKIRPAGLIALSDPPRRDSAALIGEHRSLGDRT